jgi:16S rRNA (guanine527-N7)-methyltransferase
VPELAGARRIADLGAGAGFPGLPLAIARPRAVVHLIESARRKTDLISRLAKAAAASNASPVNLRAEDWARTDGRAAYDVVTARALAPLAVILEYAAPLLEPSGTLVAWKGARDPEEESMAAKAAEILGLEPGEIVTVRPFEGSRDRHLHTYVKASPTPPRFPRRAGMAAKRPLPG